MEDVGKKKIEFLIYIRIKIWHMSGIDWFLYSKNMNDELKIFKSIKEENTGGEEISKKTPEKIKPPTPNILKISDTFNTFIEEFVEGIPSVISKDFLDIWKSSETQNKLNAFIKQKKIKMKVSKEELNQKKVEKKVKRETKMKEIQQKKVDKHKNKPKSAFFFFKEIETKKIKEEFPTLNRKDIHSELQKKWKVIKNTDESKPYKQKASEQTISV